MLIGASGTGKSSIQQAGVVSALRRQTWPEGASRPWPAELAHSRRWWYVTVQPGDHPLRALLRAFVAMWRAPDDPERAELTTRWTASLARSRDLGELLEATGDVMRERFGTAPPEKVVLIVDQWEELYQRRKESQRSSKERDDEVLTPRNQAENVTKKSNEECPEGREAGG